MRARRFLSVFALLGLLAACDASDQNASQQQPSGQPTPIAQSNPNSGAPTSGKPAAKPAAPTSKPKAKANLPIGTGFDFYVLALSWSPSYCAIEGDQANGAQCRSGRPYGFLVHGLWPQFEKGWPEDCETKSGYVDDAIVKSLRDIMPSGGLVGHQWRKHGACAGLSQQDYFTVLRAARERVVVPSGYRSPDAERAVDPDAVEHDFISSNAGLTGGGIAVTCEKGFLEEVRICLTKDLQFRSCPEIDRRGCSAAQAKMPPVAGG